MKKLKILLLIGLIVCAAAIYLTLKPGNQKGSGQQVPVAPSPNAVNPLLTVQSNQIPSKRIGQIVKSLLGFDMVFDHGKIYPQNFTAILNDIRFKGMGINDELWDCIKFAPVPGAAPTHYFLIQIKRDENGRGKVTVLPPFHFVEKTSKEGLVLLAPNNPILGDKAGKLAYYSGFAQATSAWKDIEPGQEFKDKFCKRQTASDTCSLAEQVQITLKKPVTTDQERPKLFFLNK